MIHRDPVPTWVTGRWRCWVTPRTPCIRRARTGRARPLSTPACWERPWSSTAPTRGRSAAYDAKLCGPISQLVLRNRGAGPFGLLDMVDERCGGTFDNIDDVIPQEERARFMAGYKAAAGLAIETLNKAPSTLPKGALVRAPSSN